MSSRVIRFVTLSLVLILSLLFSKAGFASPYMKLEPEATGENISVTEDGLGYVDVTSGNLFWTRNYLSFDAVTTYTSSFGLSYVGDGNGVTELGGAWRHTYSLYLNYVSGTSMSLTTRYGTTIPFTFVSGNTWISDSAYGVHLTCDVSTTPYILYDKFGNYIEFNASGQPVSIGDSFSANTITIAYSGGFISTVTDSCSRVFTLNYTGSLITSLTDNTVTGNPTWLILTYSSSDLTSIQRGYSTGVLFASDSFTYSFGVMDSYSDPDGVTISFSYTSGLLTTSTDPYLNTWSVVYNVSNTVFTDRNGLALTYTFDSSTPPCITDIDWPAPFAGGSTARESFTYDTERNCLSATSKSGSTTTYTYDTNGNMLTSVGPASLGYDWSWTYDASSRMLTQTDPLLNVTTYQYDVNGMLLYFIAADDNAASPTHPTIYSYDTNFLLSSVVSPNGYSTNYTYDANKCKAAEIKTPDGNISYSTLYTNDSWGCQLQITDATGCLTYISFDTLCRVLSVQIQYDNTPTYSTTSYTYTNSGKTLTVTDPLLNVTTYYYDSLGRCYATQFPGAPATYSRTTFDAEGNSYGYEDIWLYNYNITNSSNWFSFYYNRDSWARVTSKYKLYEDTNTTPSTWCYVSDLTEYDNDGNVIAYTTYNGNCTSYTFDALGRKLSETDPYSNSDLRVYNAAGQLSSYTNKRGYTTSYTYDVLGRKSTEVVPLATNNTTSWVYDYNGNVTLVTDRQGNTTSYTYDRMNRRLTTINDNGVVVEIIGYDGLSRIISRTDCYNCTWNTVYSPQGEIFQTIAPDSGTVTCYYDVAGNLVRTVDEVGSDSRISYDSRGRRTQVISAYGEAYQVTTSSEYSLGRKTRDIDGVGNFTDYTYYCDGSLATTDYYSPVAGSTHSIDTRYYDSQGNCVVTEDPIGRSTVVYFDLMNRTYRVTYPTGFYDEFYYDENGNRIQDDDNSYSFDCMDRCWRITDPLGSNTDRTFDSMNNVLTETVSPDWGLTLYTTTYAYDNLHNLSSETDALGNTKTFYYDLAGRKTGYLDANGNSVSYTGYDRCGRLTQITHPASLNPLVAEQTDIGYDFMGREVVHSTPDVTRRYSYDMLGRLVGDSLSIISATGASGGTSFGYDAIGRKTSITDFCGVQTTYSYDDTNLVKTVNEGGRSHYLYYDAAGQVTQKMLSSGMNENYTYDGSGKVETIMVYDNLGSLVASLIYTHGKDVLGLNEYATGYYGDYTKRRTYSANKQITSESKTGNNPYGYTYTYDGMGCRTQKIGNGTYNYTYNALGRIATKNGVSYTYDNNGNMLSDGAYKTCTYDWKNCLVHMVDKSILNGDYYLMYDMESMIIGKGWSVTNPNPSIDNFDDLNCNEEEFYMKTAEGSMLDMVYEDTYVPQSTQKRHWVECGDYLNKYLLEFNYDPLDPTGLNLSEHFLHEDAFTTHRFSSDSGCAPTTTSGQNTPSEYDPSEMTTERLLLDGANDFRLGDDIRAGIGYCSICIVDDAQDLQEEPYGLFELPDILMEAAACSHPKFEKAESWQEIPNTAVENIMSAPDGTKGSISAWTGWLDKTESGNKFSNGALITGDPEYNRAEYYDAPCGYTVVAMMKNIRDARASGGKIDVKKAMSSHPMDDPYVTYIDPDGKEQKKLKPVFTGTKEEEKNKWQSHQSHTPGFYRPLNTVKILKMASGAKSISRAIAFSAKRTKADGKLESILNNNGVSILDNTIAKGEPFVLCVSIETSIVGGLTVYGAHEMLGIGYSIRQFKVYDCEKCTACGFEKDHKFNRQVEVTFAVGIDPNNPTAVLEIPMSEKTNGGNPTLPTRGTPLPSPNPGETQTAVGVISATANGAYK